MVVRSEVEEAIEVREVDMITEVCEELGCYHWVYISIYFIKEDMVYNRDEQVGVYPDPEEKEIEDVVLYDEREHHWCIFLNTKMEGWMGRRPFYTIRSGMSTIQTRRRF